MKYGSFIVCMQQTSKVHSTVQRNTKFKAKFTVLVICHPTLFVSFVPSIIVDNQESPEHDWCLNKKTRKSYTIQYNSWMKIFVLTAWKLSNSNPEFMTAPRFSQIFFHPWSMQFYISKYAHSYIYNTFTLNLCIKISGIIQLLKFSKLCAMYLFISYIQVINIRLKKLLDIEIDTLTETEPLHCKTLHTFLEQSKGCLSHKTFHFLIVTITY